MADVTPQNIAAGTQVLICQLLALGAVWATSSAIYWPLDLAAADNTGTYWLGAIGWGAIIGVPGGLGLGLAMLGHRIGTFFNAVGLCCAVTMVYAAASQPDKFITNMGDLVARVMGG